MALDKNLMALIKGAKNKYSRGGNAVKLGDGKTLVRLLAKTGEKFWADVGVHWIKPDKNAKPVAVVGCHEIVKDSPCEVCNAIEAASKTATDDETIAIIKEWKAKKAVLVCALIRSGSKKSDAAQILELTPTTFGAMLSIVEEYANADVDVLDPTNGIDFVVEKTGSGLDTRYNVMVAPKSQPYPKDLLDNLPDLDAFIEKEHFKGEERKALNQITAITGITARPALTGPGRTALLTGSTAVVDEAEVIEESVAELEAAEAAPKPEIAKPTVTKPATASGAKPAAKVEAPATAPAGGDEFGAAMSDDEINKMLAELDSTGA